MKVVADLHIHSPYSRAVSPQMTLPNISQWANRKGTTLVGTGDFAHPEWLRYLKETLVPAGEGVFRLKDGPREPSFMLTTEIANIFSAGGKLRRNHTVLIAPSFEAVDRFVAKLNPIAKLASDGRPLVGLPTRDLAAYALEADPNFIIIPAHAWTPWFSVFGSRSGFDSLQESFGDLTSMIPAIETGLSSDPPMNWMVSALDKIKLVSFSDAHSLPNLGREATVFELERSDFPSLRDALFAGKNNRITHTIEFYPDEGKYHYDGHAPCKQRLHPDRTKELDGRCPVCGKPVTVGVLSRVNDLADRPYSPQPPAGAAPFVSAIPLAEVLADVRGVGKHTKTVHRDYFMLLERLGNEFFILMEAPIVDIERVAGNEIAQALQNVRDGKAQIEPGYDGIYGTIHAVSVQDARQSLFS